MFNESAQLTRLEFELSSMAKCETSSTKPRIPTRIAKELVRRIQSSPQWSGIFTGLALIEQAWKLVDWKLTQKLF